MARSIEDRGFACRILGKELYPDGVHVDQTGKPRFRTKSGDGFILQSVWDLRDELQSECSRLGVRYENMKRALLILEDLAEEAEAE